MNRLQQNYNGLKTNPIIEFTCLCLICAKETGQKQNIRSTLIDEEDVKRNNGALRLGLCGEHDEMIRMGHTAFYTDTRGIVLSLEANEHIRPEYRGKVIKIPEDKMDELIGKHHKE